MKKNTLIALTGGIGSGKSSVLEIISSLNYPTISCDEITKKLYNNQCVLRRLKGIFPQAISGVIKLRADKQKIAELAFSTPELYAKLTDYLTTLVYQKAMKQANKHTGKVFIEVPLLFEYKVENEFDYIIVVTRNINQRIESVIKRSNQTIEQVKQRIAKQYDYSTLPDNAIVIQNDQGLQELKQKVVLAIKKLTKDNI